MSPGDRRDLIQPEITRKRISVRSCRAVEHQQIDAVLIGPLRQC